MTRKSKFVVFILSVIPGLSHVYLGFFYRGYLFMGAVAAAVLVVLGLCALAGSNQPAVLLLGMPILWFVALIDSMTLTDRVNNYMMLNANPGHKEGSPGIDAVHADGSFTATESSLTATDSCITTQNRKIITCLLSVIPGAGHMFLGYQKLGLELMTLFFFSFFFVDWLRIGFFMFIIPVIWFYSMFDALHKASGDGGDGRIPAEKDNLSNFSVLALLGEGKDGWGGSKLLGYGLVLIGVLLLFDRIISPMIPYAIRNYLQTGIVALLFITGGIKILVGGRKVGNAGNVKAKEALEECEDGE